MRSLLYAVGIVTDSAARVLVPHVLLVYVPQHVSVKEDVSVVAEIAQGVCRRTLLSAPRIGQGVAADQERDVARAMRAANLSVGAVTV